MNVSEALGAGQEFPQNKRSPPLGENFRGQRHWTKLAVSIHGVEHGRILIFAQMQFVKLHLIISARQEKMFDSLPRDLPPKFRADNG